MRHPWRHAWHAPCCTRGHAQLELESASHDLTKTSPARRRCCFRTSLRSLEASPLRARDRATVRDRDERAAARRVHSRSFVVELSRRRKDRVMSTFETISMERLARVSGGDGSKKTPAPQPEKDIPQPVKDGVRILATGKDIYDGKEKARDVVDRGMEGAKKGYNLPADSTAERLYHALGGWAIETFNLGW
jgi:hypothetical protein